jgi:organic hydroperoxide reductase OsmC/OhrA
MSSHHARIRFQHSAGSFADKSFSRDHHWYFKGDQQLLASSAPDFNGNPLAVDPEDGFTAALASCHMLTFLAIAAVKGYAVESYEDDPIGTLDKNAEGRMAMVHVLLRPRVIFTGRQPSAEELAGLHERAHKGCFIGNSVKTEVTVEPQESAA